MATQPKFCLALDHVPDLQAAKRFYVDVLGLEVEMEQDGFVQFKSSAGANFAIASPDQSTIGSAEPEMWWTVDDAEAALAELSARDAEMTMPLSQMPFGKCFAVKDPAGQPRFILELPQPAAAGA